METISETYGKEIEEIVKCSQWLDEIYSSEMSEEAADGCHALLEDIEWRVKRGYMALQEIAMDHARRDKLANEFD